MISCPTLIRGEKITLPNASFKRNTSRKRSAAMLHPQWQRPALCALQTETLGKNKFPFFWSPVTYIVQRKKSNVFLSPSLKRGQLPSFSLRFRCPALSHCHRLWCQWFTTDLHSFHWAAHTNLQTPSWFRNDISPESLSRDVAWGRRGWNPGSSISVFGRSLVLCQHFHWCYHRKNPWLWAGCANKECVLSFCRKCTIWSYRKSNCIPW